MPQWCVSAFVRHGWVKQEIGGDDLGFKQFVVEFRLDVTKGLGRIKKGGALQDAQTCQSERNIWGLRVPVTRDSNDGQPNRG
jgi:hypothetical protein